jgi:3-oxoacyl-[acyl-carrier-protein] synthase III
MVRTRFESLGAYLPSTVVSTRELVAQMKFRPLFDLEEITGIKNRRVHGKVEGAVESSFVLATLAARDCLARSRYAAADLDVVISTSITRFRDGYLHLWEPSFSLLLKRELGARAAMHFDISNACAGMMTGVHVLDRLIKAGVVRNGMVVSGECITPIADTAVQEIDEPLDPQFGSLTVGDSGAAVILDRSESDADVIHYCELTTCAEYAQLCIGMPSDERPGAALYTTNAEMHKKERIALWPKFQTDFLARQGRTFADEGFDYVVQHQVGTRAVSNFNRFGAAFFGVPEMPPSPIAVDEFGNTSSTSHFIVLYNQLKEKSVKKGAKWLFVPAASGLVLGCVSSTITALEV